MKRANYEFNVTIEAPLLNTEDDRELLKFVRGMRDKLKFHIEKRLNFGSMPTQCKLIFVEYMSMDEIE